MNVGRSSTPLGFEHASSLDCRLTFIGNDLNIILDFPVLDSFCLFCCCNYAKFPTEESRVIPFLCGWPAVLLLFSGYSLHSAVETEICGSSSCSSGFSGGSSGSNGGLIDGSCGTYYSSTTGSDSGRFSGCSGGSSGSSGGLGCGSCGGLSRSGGGLSGCLSVVYSDFPVAPVVV